MADGEFERQLQRLFASAPAFADGRQFAARVQGRLERGWAWRRTMITAAGVLGGAVAVAQIGGSHLLHRAAAIPQVSIAAVEQATSRAVAALPLPTEAFRGAPFGSEGLWLLAGLAVLAIALAAGRLLEEI